jgi:4-hydroxy-tetrahydrodipicolinate reductase
MNIALIGYGKMGKAIEEVAVAKGHTIVLKIDIDTTAEFTTENLQKADVAIEFTSPHSAVNNITTCIQAGVPVVCGSTGWLQHWPAIEVLVQQHQAAMVYSSNYSIGVNLFFKITEYVSGLMAPYTSYEASLTEIHHTEKKDAPSGTAITLAEKVLAHTPQKKQWVNHSSNNPSDLTIVSERIDPAPGTHTVHFKSVIDDIEITHTAHNRKGFAGGAVLAAEFIIGKKGIYNMQEVLGI